MTLLRRIAMFCTLFWQLAHVFFQLLYGVWRISKLNQPLVSVFGGARIGQDTVYFLQAHQVARRLVENNISVITGGGPGIMEAANCGAMDIKQTKARSIGIMVANLGEDINPCVHECFELNYFFARKWLLTQYSKAFVIFPGGFGTLDELFEVLTLMQTKKMARVPIILVGSEYWQPFKDWIMSQALVRGAINPDDIGLFTVTDDLEEVICLVMDECSVALD